MKVVCAWCGLVLKDGAEVVVYQTSGGAVPPSKFPSVSHSICGPCKARVLAEAEGERVASLVPAITSQGEAVCV